jgi:hypothetical protein
MNTRYLLSVALLSLSAPTVIGCDQRVGAIEQVATKAQAENPADCPAEPTSDMGRGLPCSLPAGTVCAYRVSGINIDDGKSETHGWAAYACGCETSGVWSEAGVAASDSGTCPDEPPVAGDSCDPDAYRSVCPYYPGITFSCNSYGTWLTTIDTWICAGS